MKAMGKFPHIFLCTYPTRNEKGGDFFSTFPVGHNEDKPLRGRLKSVTDILQVPGCDQGSLKEMRSRTDAHRNNSSIKERFDVFHFTDKNLNSEDLKRKQYGLVNTRGKVHTSILHCTAHSKYSCHLMNYAGFSWGMVKGQFCTLQETPFSSFNF